MFYDFIFWTLVAGSPIMLMIALCKEPPVFGDGEGVSMPTSTETQQQKDLFGLLDYHARDAFINHNGTNPINRLKGDK